MTTTQGWDYAQGYEAHPLWEQQVELERGMLKAGADKVRDRTIIAESRGKLTRTTAVRGLLDDWLPGVAAAVKSWVSDVERSRGPKPTALPYIKSMDPYVAALIALRSLLDGIGTARQKVVRLAEEIGRTCEHEQRIRHWEAKSPDLYYHYKDEMDRNRATATHRRRVNINRFNMLLKEGTHNLQWESWGPEVQFRVGVELLNVIIRATGWFEVQPDPEYVWRPNKTNRPALVIAGRPGFTEWLGRTMDNVELRSPEFRPTIIPPRRWARDPKTGEVVGGYHTPYVNSPRLIRFKAHQETQREYAAAEYARIDMPFVYEALHALQETAWMVNRRVLDVAVKVWAASGPDGVAKLPSTTDRELPTRTPRMEEHAELVRQWKQNGRKGDRPAPDEQTDAEILAWKRGASPVYRFNAKRLSKARSTSDTILIAQQYADFDRFYFPHMLDFRGRIYPIASFLQPQGNDLARGLLTFADGLPITEQNHGADWLAIHLANVWGNDKVSLDARVDWVFQNEGVWRAIAADPYTQTEWQTADKPFQTLAAIYEWVGYLEASERGETFVSNLPVMVDGTCNGIQHLSAILRDEVSGRYVNLVPSGEPQDIYKFVARQLQDMLERIERAGGPEGNKATYWLHLCNRDLPRTLTKRQVMVLPYGGTRDSFYTYTRQWLDEADPPSDKATKEEAELRTRHVTFLTNHLWSVVNEVVKGGMTVMKWLQDCAKAVAVANQPIFWATPSGFVVRHFYGINQDRQVKIMLDGERHDVVRSNRTDKLSSKEQTQGIAPNFIHSLDASALVDCIRMSKEHGIEDFVAVHDAYGTHAANMEPLGILLRRAFVMTHRRDVLGEFRAACTAVLVDHLVATEGLDPLVASEKANEMLPAPLEKGSLDIEQVLESDYFFA